MSNLPQPASIGWSTGFCQCCAQPGGLAWCLYAYCCTPCAFGSNAALLPKEALIWGGGNCCGGCLLYTVFLCGGVPCIVHMMTRGYIRKKYNIDGGEISDFLMTWWCPACALCQEHRELVSRGCVPQGECMLAAGDVPKQQVIV